MVLNTNEETGTLFFLGDGNTFAVTETPEVVLASDEHDSDEAIVLVPSNPNDPSVPTVDYGGDGGNIASYIPLGVGAVAVIYAMTTYSKTLMEGVIKLAKTLTKRDDNE